MDQPGALPRPRLPYLPALDGVRAIAVVAVLLFHAGFSWARGGFLGVTMFFALSGFLITSLLLVELDATGRIDLKRFWSRRARRLVPAVLLLMVVVLVYVHFSGNRRSDGLLGDAVASLTWVANWRFVFSHRSYAALFSSPSPFQHMWSLAIEEQFYVAFPLFLLAAIGWRASKRHRGRAAVAVLTGIVASTVACVLLHHPGTAPGRAYYGTDARVAEPLVGVLLALALVSRGGLRVLSRGWRIALDTAALASAGGLAVLVMTLTDHSDRLYGGGFVLAASLTAVVIAAATQPGSWLRWPLSTAPFVWLGRISYGVYVFHWPVFLWLSHHRTGLAPAPLLALRTAVTVALAALSYALVEQPVREGRPAGWPAGIAWADVSTGLIGALVMITWTGSGAVASASPSAAKAHAAAGRKLAAAPIVPTRLGPGATATTVAPAVTTTVPAAVHAKRAPDGAGAAALTPPNRDEVPPVPTDTVAANGKPKLRVVVIGDSMASGLGDALARWADARGDVVVYNLAIRGCPIAPTGTYRFPDYTQVDVNNICAWWLDSQSARSTALRQFSANLAVTEDGAMEIPDRLVPTWSTFHHAGDTQFDKWALDEYHALKNILTSNNKKLLALNGPCADWEQIGGVWEGFSDGSGDTRMQALNRTIAAAATPGGQIGDLFSHLCPNGRFTNTVDGVSNARPDGYHLSSAAADAVVAKWLGPLVLQAAGLVTSPTPTPTSTPSTLPH